MFFFIKLGRHASLSERMDSIDFGGHRSKLKVTIDMCGNKFVITINDMTIETKPLCASSSNFIGRHVNHNEMMNPIDFGGQRSKFKVTIDIYGKKLLNTKETKPWCASSSNLADMLTMVRG